LKKSPSPNVVGGREKKRKSQPKKEGSLSTRGKNAACGEKKNQKKEGELGKKRGKRGHIDDPDRNPAALRKRGGRVPRPEKKKTMAGRRALQWKGRGTKEKEENARGPPRQDSGPEKTGAPHMQEKG